LKTISNKVAGDVRTVVLTRPQTGESADYYSFDTSKPDINLLSAIGKSFTFGYHKNRTTASVTLTSTSQ
jgi:hypothetical protein